MGNWWGVGLKEAFEERCRGVVYIDWGMICVMYIEGGESILWKRFNEVIVVGVHWRLCGVGGDVVEFNDAHFDIMS